MILFLLILALQTKQNQSTLDNASETQQGVDETNSKNETPSDIIFVPIKVDHNRDISHLVTPRFYYNSDLVITQSFVNFIVYNLDFKEDFQK